MQLAGINRNVSYLTVCNALCNTSTALEIAINALVGAMLAEDKSLATLPHAFRWLTTMVVAFPAAWTMRVLGRRNAFMVGALFGIIGAGIGVWAIFLQSFWLFVVGTVVMGVFNSFANFYRFAAAEAAEAAFRPKAISLVIGGGIVAAFIGPEIAKHTVELFAPYTFAGTYIALAVIPVLLLIALLPIDLPAPRAEERAKRGRPTAEIMRQKRFIVAALGGMIGWGGMVLLMTATPLSMVACGHSFSDSAFVIQWHIV
ncbi:MAG: MFS transporter, partial [Alphaproteobacteria bacterium]|nr:MFS transporter [Alphaproteobacteria bacterium]